MEKIKKGDYVVCQTGVSGIVISFYTPTSCEEQTKVRTDDGRLYHAPTRMWRHYKDGLNAGTVIMDDGGGIHISIPSYEEYNRRQEIKKELNSKFGIDKTPNEYTTYERELNLLGRTIPNISNEISNSYLDVATKMAINNGISTEQAIQILLNVSQSFTHKSMKGL